MPGRRVESSVVPQKCLVHCENNRSLVVAAPVKVYTRTGAVTVRERLGKVFRRHHTSRCKAPGLEPLRNNLA